MHAPTNINASSVGYHRREADFAMDFPVNRIEDSAGEPKADGIDFVEVSEDEVVDIGWKV